MKRRGILPFDSEHLTAPEKSVQHDMERRHCCSCSLLQYRSRSGARMCEIQEQHDYTPADVLAGNVICEDWIEKR